MDACRRDRDDVWWQLRGQPLTTPAVGETVDDHGINLELEAQRQHVADGTAAAARRAHACIRDAVVSAGPGVPGGVGESEDGAQDRVAHGAIGKAVARCHDRHLGRIPGHSSPAASRKFGEPVIEGSE